MQCRLGSSARGWAATVLVVLGFGAGAAAAQSGPSIEFDLITFDAMRVDNPPGGSFAIRLGLLVNTGTVPITPADWLAGTTHAHADVPVQNFAFHVSAGTGPGGFTLLPGQAIGNNHPLLTALLQPGETLAVDLPLEVLSLQAEGAVPDSAAELSFCVQAGARVVQAGASVHFGPGAGFLFDPTSARRTRAVPAQSAVALAGTSCDPLAQLSAMGAPAGGSPGLVAFGSNMPTLGNDAFALGLGYCPAQGKDPCPQAPFLLLLSAAPSSVVVKGCPVWVDPGTAVTLVGQLGPGGFKLLPAPIPANPALLGAAVSVQAAFLSHAAPNGMFASSNALRITIGNDCEL